MITIVVPVYNRASAVASMLSSIEAQSHIPEEVILVDNNSSDNSLEVLNAWARRMNERGWKVTVISQPKPGAAAARKAGEQLVKTPYVAFFDSDDLMHPDFVAAALEDFKLHPNLKLTVWNLNYHNPDGSVTRRRLIPSHPLENHLVQGLLSTLAYAVDTEYLRSVGGWNPDIGGWDDWELGLRLLAGGGKFMITDIPRAEITVQKDSISGLSYLHRKGDWEKTINEMERVLLDYAPAVNLQASSSRDVKHKPEDNICEISLKEADIRFALRLLAYRRAILAAHYRHEGDKEGSRILFNEAIKSPYLNSFHRLMLRGAYRLTRTGCRGAGYIFPRLLRK